MGLAMYEVAMSKKSQSVGRLENGTSGHVAELATSAKVSGRARRRNRQNRADRRRRLDMPQRGRDTEPTEATRLERRERGIARRQARENNVVAEPIPGIVSQDEYRNIMERRAAERRAASNPISDVSTLDLLVGENLRRSSTGSPATVWEHEPRGTLERGDTSAVYTLEPPKTTVKRSYGEYKRVYPKQV